MKKLQPFILLLALASLFSIAYSEVEIPLNSAHTTENVVISNNKFNYTFDLPTNTEALVRTFLPELTSIENVEIILSDGTVVTTENQGQYNIEIQLFVPSYETDIFISPTKALIISFGTAFSGITQIKGDITGDIPTTLPLDMRLTGSNINFGSFYFPNRFLQTNQDVTFSQYIYEGGEAPQNTANVVLKVFQGNVLLATHTMKDDGLLNDFEAEDGAFTKTINFSEYGKYTIEIETVVTDSTGLVHINTDIKTVDILVPSPFSLTGLFTEELIDSNGNGLADKLRIVFEYASAPAAGEKYHIQASIGSDSNFYDLQRVNVDNTTTEIALEFNGLKISERHISGPIKFTDVRIKNLNTRRLLEINKSFGQTSSYFPSQFERPNEIINQSNATFTLVDNDNDNIYEGISIEFIADVLSSGNYQAKVELKETKEKIVKGDVDLPLTVGIHPINIFIPSMDITSIGLNGPVNLNYFRFYRYDVNNWEMIERDFFGTSPNFNCWDFGDCSSHGENTLPIAIDDSYQGIEGFSNVILNVLSNDSDNDSDDLIITNFSTPSNGYIGTDENSLLYYVPNQGFTGIDTFTYTINDIYPPNGIAKGGESTGNVQVNIRSNTQSSLTGDIFTVIMNQAKTLDVLANDSDADGDTLFITSIDQPINGQVELVNSAILYTPNIGYSGVDNFFYSVKEKDEVTNLTGTTTYGAEVILNVIPPNQDPIAVSDTVNLNINEQLLIDVLANDSDPDSDPISISSISEAQYGSTLQIDDSQIQYTAPASATSDSFTYTISDGKGGTAQATVNVEVLMPNYPPIANDDSDFIQTEATNIFDVLANDTDQNSDVLSIASVASATTPVKGNIAIVDNKIEFTAYQDESGTQLINYTVEDPYGSSDQGQLTIRINELPEPNPDSYTVLSGQTTSLDVLSNDIDNDGDMLTLSSVTASKNASIIIESGHINYTPNIGFKGNDNFSYTVDDGFGGEADTNVSIFVNIAPVATDDNFNFAFNTQQVLDVTSNDYDDNVGDTLQVISIGSANNGVISLENGQVNYMPSYNYIGLDQFSYTIEDSYGQQSTASVSLTIYEQAPEAITDLFVRAGESLNVIAWAPVKNAISYRIYYGSSIDDVNNKIQYIDTSDNFYEHKMLTNGARYYYSVESRGVTTISPISQIAEAMPNPLTWGTPQRIYDYGTGTDFFNDLETAWEQNTSGIIVALLERENTKMVAKRFHPKKGWGADHLIFNHLGDGFSNSLLAVDIAESGHGIVVAKESSSINASKKVMASIYDPINDTWSAPIVVVDYSASSNSNAFNLRAAINNNGEAVIAWQGPNYYGDASIKTYSVENGLSTRKTVDSTSTLQVEDIKLAINDTGSIVVSLAYDNRARPSDASTGVTIIIDGVQKNKVLSSIREPYLYSYDAAAAVPYIDNLNNIRIVSASLDDHYFDYQADIWSLADIYPVPIGSLNRFNVKFGSSIDDVVLMYEEFNSSEPPYIIFSESFGNWGLPVSVPTEAGKNILANSPNQVVVKGLTGGFNYSVKGELLTWNKITYEWSVEEIYSASTYLGHHSDLLLADGYGSNTALVMGYFSEYRVIDSIRNTSPIVIDMQYPSVDESTDVIFEAVNSVDIDGDIVSWQWQHVSGPYALLLNPNDATTKVLLGTTDVDGISVSKLTVTDANNNSSEALFSIPMKDIVSGMDNTAPSSSVDVNSWTNRSTKTKYKTFTITTDGVDSKIFWLYSGDDIFNGGNYTKDIWHLYDDDVSFQLSSTGGRLYYYAIDRSGNKEDTQDVKVGGKGK